MIPARLMPYEETIKLVVSAVVLGAVLFFGYRFVHNYNKDQAELQTLRTYKVSVEAQQQVSQAADTNFHAQQAAATAQQQALTTQRIVIETRQDQLAHEDSQVADFFSMPIPQRLRDEDRAAREQRQLDAGQGAR